MSIHNPTHLALHNFHYTVFPTIASGLSWDLSLQANALNELAFLAFDLETGAAVANRRVHLQTYDGANYTTIATSPLVQTASLTWRYFFIPNGPIRAIATELAIWLPLPPDLRLTPDKSFRMLIDNVQGGDDSTHVLLYLKLWTAG